MWDIVEGTKYGNGRELIINDTNIWRIISFNLNNILISKCYHYSYFTCKAREHLKAYLGLGIWMDFAGGSASKESACNAGDSGQVPGSGRSPGGGHMATHSSILVWKIPWIEEPSGL